MVRKFLYFVAVLLVLIIAAAFALRLWGDELAEVAFVPSGEFVEQDALADNAYRDPAMWLSRPGLAQRSDPARWQPDGRARRRPGTRPSSRSSSSTRPAISSAPTGTRRSTTRSRAARARTFLRGLASAVRRGRARSGRRAIARRLSARS